VKTWLHKRNGFWGAGCPSNVTNLAVKAFFGGGAVPADISYAAAWLAAQAISAQLGMSLSLKSESIEGYSRTFTDMTKDNVMITNIFNNYTEVLIG
jgi:5-enolpyruvylshikimate-3-phosphate synthase